MRKAGKCTFRLLHISGCIEPYLLPKMYPTWEELEEGLVGFLRSGNYERDEDGLFFLELKKDGTANISSFSGGFMAEMQKRADKEKS